jgi:hypothetical protein
MGLIPREWVNLFKEGNMFPNSNEIQKTRKKYNSQMYQSGISTFREIGEVEASALKDGVLAQTYKELIALGISISNGCYG